MKVKGIWTALTVLAALSFLAAQNTNFHGAPESAKQMKNPLEDRPMAVKAGRQLFTHNCTRCHGWRAEGNGEIPSLVDGALESVTSGELFWFITKGAPANGMPAWKKLPESQRWELVSS